MALPSAVSDGAQTTKPGLLRALMRNLSAGLGLALFRRRQVRQFVVSADQLLLLAVLAVVLDCASDYLLLSGPSWFNPIALSYAGTGLLLLLVGAYLTARLQGQPASALTLLVLLLSMDPLFIAVSGLVELSMGYAWAGQVGWYLYLGAFVWVVVAWLRALRVAFPAGHWKTGLSMVVMCSTAILPFWWLPQQRFWYPDDLEGEAQAFGYESLDVEAAYYRQPALVQAAVDALEPERPGVVDLYHIGFGSYAEQGVFRREVLHVQDILDERLATAGRSLVLINSRETLDEVPLASRTNLGLALQGVAQHMNPDEDVLLLYLTSHGSQDGTLAVDFWPLQLNALDAQELRRLLDQSGIRWRVVVISACYSGSFIEALKGERTLIMTAAASDRQSFGCSNENEYTYFGEALFKQALAETASLTEAFALAERRIAAREQAEQREPSRPMMAAGGAILDQLRIWEQQRPGADSAALRDTE